MTSINPTCPDNNDTNNQTPPIVLQMKTKNK